MTVGSVSSSSSCPTALEGASNVAVANVGGGTYAFVAGYWSGQLTAINITNPIAPSIAGCTTSATSMVAATNITISGHYAYVTAKNRNASSSSNDDGSGNGLTIVDISNPASPSVVGSLQDPAHLFGAYAVQIVGNYAYVSSQGLLTGQPSTPDTSAGSLSVIDVSNPASPVLASSVDNSAVPNNGLQHATSVAVASFGGHTYAYVTAYYSHRLAVLDVSSPTATPVPVISVQSAGDLSNPNDIVIQGNYAYVVNQSGSNAQLSIWNASSPQTLSSTPVGSLNNPALSGAYRVRILHNIAYISGSNSNAIAMVDVSNPAAPVFLGSDIDGTNLNSASSVSLDSAGSGVYAIGVSPKHSSQSNPIYPPYPLQSGGPSNTGTVAVVQVDPASFTAGVSSGPSNPTAATSANFSFGASDQVALLSCKLDGGASFPCDSGTFTTGSLTPGSHTFAVQATDAAGNTVSSTPFPWWIGAPVNTTPPSISGTAVVGNVVRGSSGAWNGSPTLSNQWMRCDATGANCSAIHGATGASYAVSAADLGSTIELQVTATNSVGNAVASSPPSKVRAVSTTRPASTSVPLVSGADVQGAKLSVALGAWSGNPAPALTVTWERCDSSGNHCTAIAGQTGSSYQLTASDVGSRLKATVTGSNVAGSASVSTPLTAVVSWSSVSSITATLHHAKSSKPGLGLNVPALGSGVEVQKLSFSLPRGLKFASLKALLKALSIDFPARSALKYKATVRRGVLTLTLTRPAPGAVVALGSAALKLSRGEAKQLKSKHAKAMKIAITVFYAGLPPRQVTVSVRLA